MSSEAARNGAAPRQRSEAEQREYTRKLDRDLRILRVLLPVMSAIASVMVIALTAYIIVVKL